MRRARAYDVTVVIKDRLRSSAGLAVFLESVTDLSDLGPRIAALVGRWNWDDFYEQDVDDVP